jgi:hypothetical protein
MHEINNFDSQLQKIKKKEETPENKIESIEL